MILEAHHAFELAYRGAPPGGPDHRRRRHAGQDPRQGSVVLSRCRFHPRLIPRVARGRRGLRAWRRSAAATLTGPARLSSPMTRLRRVAMTFGVAPVLAWEPSSAKVVSRRWCRGGGAAPRSPSAPG